MKKTVLVKLVLTALLVWPMAGCVKASLTMSGTVVSDTADKTREVEVSGAETKVRIYLKATLERGTMHVTLFDPDGEKRWEAIMDKPGERRERESFDVIDGMWKLNVKTDKFAGKYRVRVESE